MFRLDELLIACSGKLSFPGKEKRITGISTDSRSLKPGQAFLALRGKNFDGHLFIPQAIRQGASCIIHDAKMARTNFIRGVPFIEVEDTEKALGLIGNYQRRKYNPAVIAVTGSTGKTTCKEMIAFVLEEKLKVLKNEGTKNNQIGLPMTLVGLDAGHEAAILELGTNHFGEIASLARIAEPNVAVVTNIGDSHLEYFGDRGGVWREKKSLLASLKAPAVAVLNSDDRFQRRAINADSGIFTLSCGKTRSDISISRVAVRKGKVEFIINGKYEFRLNTPGAHNAYNAAMATAVGLLFGVSIRESSRRLSVFKFPPGRLNVRRIRGVTFLDDTYNSNPTSLSEALSALKNFNCRGRKIMVMGDMLELGRNAGRSHRESGDLVTGCCDIFVACGRLSRHTASRVGLEKKNKYSCLTSFQARDILWSRICPTCRDLVLVKGSRAMKMEEVMK